MEALLSAGPVSDDVADNILSVMTAGELRDCLGWVRERELRGSVTRAEAKRWRNRIEARVACLEPGSGEFPD